MKEELEVFVGRQIPDSDLRKSIRVYNRNRNLLRELSRLRTRGQVSLTHADNLAIVKASMMMPIEESSAALTNILEEIRLHSGPQDMKDSVRIFLFGLFCESHSIFNSLDQLGMHVVNDNLYNGTRYFLQDVDEEVDPVEGLVGRHLAKDPLSCFHYPRGQWRRHLIERITDNEIEGFVYLTPRYCDAMAFDYPAVKELLQELDIPVLLLEMDSSSMSKGQLRTRLEAFAEVLSLIHI